MLLVVSGIGAACTAPSAAVVPSATDPAHPTAVPSSELAPLPSSRPSAPIPSAAAGRLLFLRDGPGTSTDAIVAVSATTGRLVARLPLGVADAGWSVLYAAATLGDQTTVTAYDPHSGSILRRASLPGSFALPVVLPGGLPGGLAGDGHRLVLVDRAPQPGSSRFAFLDTGLTSPPRYISIPGDFGFDALSPDAGRLYLIEHLGPTGSGHYQVRAYDSAADTLMPGAIVDKRNIGEAMQGRPLARVSTATGDWAYTLYARSNSSLFIHALDTVDALAVCIDLPARAHPDTIGGAWMLALGEGPASDRLYAVDPILGSLLAVNLQTYDPGQLASIARSGPATGLPPVMGVAVSSDGTLWIAAPDGLRVIDAARLTQSAHLFAGVAVSAVTADGTSVLTLGVGSHLSRVTLGVGGAPMIQALR
jgi:hypothetical protein